MGVIQNSVNQMLGVGALIAGKARTDYNNSVMASENIDTKRRIELYNKQLNNGLNHDEKNVQTALNKKFKHRVDKYTGKGIFKNSDLRRYYESQNVDRNIALDQVEKDNNEAAEEPKVGSKEGNDPDYDPDEEKRQEATIEEYNKSLEQPSIQQVMAEQQMNKVDEETKFKKDTKEMLEIRKDHAKNKGGKYVVNMNTINGKPLNPNDLNNDTPIWKAQQIMAKQMELDSKNKKENK